MIRAGAAPQQGRCTGFFFESGLRQGEETFQHDGHGGEPILTVPGTMCMIRRAPSECLPRSQGSVHGQISRVRAGREFAQSGQICRSSSVTDLATTNSSLTVGGDLQATENDSRRPSNRALAAGTFRWTEATVVRPTAAWSFQRYATYWLTDNGAAHKASTRKFYQTNLTQYLYPAMGGIAIRAIDRGLCKAVVKGLQKVRGVRTKAALS